MITTLQFSRTLPDGFSASWGILWAACSAAVAAGRNACWTRAAMRCAAPGAGRCDLVACPGKDCHAPNFGISAYFWTALNQVLRTTRMCSRRMCFGCMDASTTDAHRYCRPGSYAESLQRKAAASVQHLAFHRQPLARRRRQHQVRQWWCSLVELVVSAAYGVCLGNQAQLCSAHLTGGLQGNQQPIVEGA